jgi:MFS family permease
MIEKKTAARYKKDMLSPPSEQETAHDETTPLLATSPSVDDNLKAYSLPPPSSWLTRKMPIVRTFRSPALLTAFYIGFVQAFLIGSYDSTIPLVALEYYNFNSLQSGLLFLALGIPGFFSGPLAGWAVDKFGTRIVAILGYGYLVPIHILLRIPRPGDTHQVVIFATILALASIGNSVIDSPSLVEAGLVVEKYHKANPTLFGDTGPYAQLYGMNSMMFSLGVTVGPLVAGALKEEIGYGNMNAVMGAICFSAAVLSWVYLSTEPKLGCEEGVADLSEERG